MAAEYTKGVSISPPGAGAAVGGVQDRAVAATHGSESVVQHRRTLQVLERGVRRRRPRFAAGAGTDERRGRSARDRGERADGDAPAVGSPERVPVRVHTLSMEVEVPTLVDPHDDGAAVSVGDDRGRALVAGG